MLKKGEGGRCQILTSNDTTEISMAFKETSSSSLSGVDTRNSGSILFRLWVKIQPSMREKSVEMKRELIPKFQELDRMHHASSMHSLKIDIQMC